ncbi:hypothetical protein GWO43_01525 [candidate division KSB1 bacterium]|nr:hypothetical protein [candidate division KSB1 bacterium]NIX69278.1 hypothetical protein [candidate division KSB1 bacterium]
MDKFTIRGLVYSAVSCFGLGYEVFFIHPPRLFLLIMYSIVIGIGLLCVFVLNDQKEPFRR